VSPTVILETLRRHFAHLAYVAAVLMILIIGVTMAAVDGPTGAALEMMKVFIIITGCQLIGPEFSSGTLQLILSKPIHRARYLLSRVAGVVLALWIVIALAYSADVIARSIGGHKIAWLTGGGAAVAVIAQAVLVCSLMALFGSFTRSYLNVALYLGGQILLSMFGGFLQIISRLDRGAFAVFAAFLRAHPEVISTIRTIDQNLYPDPPPIPFDRNWLLLVVSNAAIALLLACVIFRNREVPYGAD
jgi:ABC-type transport system involved in multi-copper enzyme maturation permease subunit